MVHMPVSDPIINALLFKMTNLSPLVKESIELELYRSSADSDGATDNFILEDSFMNLIRDLDTIGITFTFDYTELVEDYTRLSHFLVVATHLLPNGLYEILKTSHRIRGCVSHILEGSLGDNETLLQTYLSELGGLDGQPALVPEMTETLDWLYPVIGQTEVFTDYLRNVHKLAMQERMAIESDPKEHLDYTNYVREVIGRLSDAVNALSDHPLYNKLCRIQNIIISDFIAPVNYIDYNYLFSQSKDTLPDELHESYDRKRYHYRVSHKWCLDYYTLRKIEPSLEFSIMITCFAYAMNSAQADFNVQIANHPVADVDQTIAALYRN